MKKSLVLMSMLAVAAGAARADDPPPPPFTANVAVTSNYKYRGQDQGNNKPAIQGGFDYTMNGFYVGNWNSSIGFTSAGIEMDFYGGYRGEFAKDFGYDVGILQYYYPQKDKVVSFDTTEIYGALTFNVFTLKYSHTVSSDYFGFGESFEKGVPLTYRPKGRNTGYLDLSANVPLVDKLTLNAHVGYTRFPSALRNIDDGTGMNIGLPNYYDYKLGLTYDLGSGFSLAGAVVGANKKNYYGDVNKVRGIVSISKSM